MPKKKHGSEKRKRHEKQLLEQVIELRQDYLYSEALIYFLCSGYVMLGTTIPPSSLSLFGTSIPWIQFPYWFSVLLSIVLVIGALSLFILSFVHETPHAADTVRRLIGEARVVPYGVFAIEMLRAVNEMILERVTPVFVVPYFYTGFLLTIMIVVQQIYVWIRNRRG